MYFNATSTVTIGGKQLLTVISIKIKQDSKDIGGECDIEVPLSCRIDYDGTKSSQLPASAKNLFAVGDKVVIKAQYEGYDELDLFEGFVNEFVEGMPTTIKCMDYTYKLKMAAPLKLSYKSVDFQTLVKKVLEGTGVSLIPEKLNISLKNVTKPSMTPLDILKEYKKDLLINISLQGPKLYVNVASDTLEVVKLNSGVNVIKADLQQADSVNGSFRIKAKFLQANGKQSTFEMGEKDGKVKEINFAGVTNNKATFLKLVHEAYIASQRQIYTGSVTTLLYPDCRLYDKVEYKDVRFPARSASYVITGIDIELTQSGYQRKLQLAYLINPVPGEINPLTLDGSESSSSKS